MVLNRVGDLAPGVAFQRIGYRDKILKLQLCAEFAKNITQLHSEKIRTN
jgi:hypothetical protein